jgi:DNA primase
MTRRFSAQELSFLRNQVPINRVIETMLSVATGNNNGKLSFACPVCRSMNTGINTRHNLARCFDCRQNHNPIEFVMHQLHLNFVDSVKWLKQYNRHPMPEKTSPPSNPSAQPVSIGDLLSGMLAPLPAKTTADPATEALTKRISDLEHSVERLDLLIKEIRSLVDQR